MRAAELVDHRIMYIQLEEKRLATDFSGKPRVDEAYLKAWWVKSAELEDWRDPETGELLEVKPKTLQEKTKKLSGEELFKQNPEIFTTDKDMIAKALLQISKQNSLVAETDVSDAQKAAAARREAEAAGGGDGGPAESPGGGEDANDDKTTVGGSSSSSSAQKNFTPDTIPENEAMTDAAIAIADAAIADAAYERGLREDEQAAIAAALEQEGSSSDEDAVSAEEGAGDKDKKEPTSLGLDLAAADREIKAGLVNDLPDDLDELDD